MILQVAFVMLVIYITHKIYEACFGAKPRRRQTASQSSSTTRPTTHSSATKPSAPPAYEADASSSSSHPTHNPPTYESIYPDLTKIKQAKTASENPGLWGWLFGSGSGDSSNTFQTIIDKFHTLDEVTDAVRHAGLESSNILFGKFALWVTLLLYN